MIRTSGGYRSLASLKVISKEALPSPAQALTMCRNSEDDVVMVAVGGDTHPYRFDRGQLNWQSIGPAAGYPGAVFWNFVEFGDTLLASNGVGHLQTYNTLGGGPGTFVDIPNSPKAKFLTLVKDQLVAGFYPDSNGVQAISRVGWSALDDPTDWVPNATTMSDFQDNPDCGALMGLVGGSYGVALFETAVKRFSLLSIQPAS